MAQQIEAAGIERTLPKFGDLPLQKDHPQYSAWGLWGEDDEAGTLVGFSITSCIKYNTISGNSQA